MVVESKIARSAWLGIKVSDLTGSAARARVIATDAGGQVTSENVVTAVDPTGGPAGPQGVDPQLGAGTSVPDVGVDEARMVLSVPAKALDDVLTQLSKIGSVSYRSSQSQDVTDSYIDTKARIQPMRDGIDRVRALLAKTTDLQQVITLESELSRRQADLDSLEQRLAKLDAMTTTSDVTVTLWTDATTPVPTQSGIAGGLRTAWDSLLGSVTVILTGLAALLPWLVLLVPLTLLALRVWRRRSAGMPSATSHMAGDPAALSSPPAPAETAGASSPAGPGALPLRRLRCRRPSGARSAARSAVRSAVRSATEPLADHVPDLTDLAHVHGVGDADVDDDEDETDETDLDRAGEHPPEGGGRALDGRARDRVEHQRDPPGDDTGDGGSDPDPRRRDQAAHQPEGPGAPPEQEEARPRS